MTTSATLLSLTTILALTGIVLTSVAFCTNSWRTYRVDRSELLFLMAQNGTLRRQLSMAMNRTNVYFNRNVGLFRECYPNQVPVERGTERTLLGAWCIGLYKDLQLLPSTEKQHTEHWTTEQWIRTNLLRATIVLYALALLIQACTLITGVCGCWRRRGSLICVTGFLLLAASLLVGAAMATWHGADYLSRDVIQVWPYERTWDMLLVSATRTTFGYSYILSWIGFALVHIASLLALTAYRAMTEEALDWAEKRAAPYLTPAHYEKNALVPYSNPTGSLMNHPSNAIVPYYGGGQGNMVIVPYYGVNYNYGEMVNAGKY